MIYTRLAGGLGNQLFQFAAAIALRGQDGRLFLGTGGLGRYDVPRDFELAHLLELPKWCEHDHGQRSTLQGQLLNLRIGRVLPIVGVDDRSFEPQLQLAHRGRQFGLRWLDGYFQQGWEWPPFEQPLAAIQTMVRTDLPATDLDDCDCVIHVRGGDFLAKEIHRVVDERFYQRALVALREHTPTLGTARVVTDDPNHAADLVRALATAAPDVRFEIAPKSDGWPQDFQRIRNAPARIIGNSTFSWWAAALDTHRAPTIAPSRWIRDARRRLFLPWETPIDAP